MSQDEPIKIAPTAPQANTEQLEQILENYRHEVLHNDDGKRGEEFDKEVVKSKLLAWNKATVQQAVKAAFEVHHQQYPDCPPKLLSKEQADE